MEKNVHESVTAELLLEEIKVLLKEYFVAKVRKKGDELELRFLGGEVFLLTVWQVSESAAKG